MISVNSRRVCLVLHAGCANNNPADIVFVLDESGSIWNPDFNKQIQFVKVHGYLQQIVTHLCMQAW